MKDFDIYATEIDSECLSQDFDDVDLYSEHIYDNSDEEDDCNINFEY